MMSAKQYFEDVRTAGKRAVMLANIADEMSSSADSAKAIRYDRVNSGRAKNGYKNVDGLLDTVSRMESTRERALDQKEIALALVAEATAIIEKALEDRHADVQALEAVYAYYVRGIDEAALANRYCVDRSVVGKRRRRGLTKLEPYVPH